MVEHIYHQLSRNHGKSQGSLQERVLAAGCRASGGLFFSTFDHGLRLLPLITLRGLSARFLGRWRNP